MNPDLEIQRLRELLPASGRMRTVIRPARQTRRMIDAPFPKPWQWGDRTISINFNQWAQLPEPERDLLVLRTVSWLVGIQWFKPDLYQSLAAAATGGILFELIQQDAVGILVSGGLGAIALRQIWQQYRSPEREVDADTAAIQIAQRRGYDLDTAAGSLLSAIKTVAQLEGRSSLSYVELLRCQNLKAQRNLQSATTSR
ncbi:MAG: DUF3318 domain-containing protein [Spirulina sp. SIO3F2]|nr:DUF3318 domain-containing protein [Spirulina sp. SIO3F2]